MGILFWSIIAVSFAILIYAGVAAIAFMPQLRTAFSPLATPSPSPEPTFTSAVVAEVPATVAATNSPTPSATESPTTLPGITPSLTLAFTSTPTIVLSASPALTDTPGQTPTDNSTPTETFTPTETATLTPTVTPEGGGWTFINIRVTSDPDESDPNIVIYGEVINNSGINQEIAAITGTFFDAQGQTIANEDSTTDFWPLEAVPPGGRMPFELYVDGISSAASYKLRAEASPGLETPRQNFEFSSVSQTNEASSYCLSGKARNPGEALNSYLTIVVTIYNNQNAVINFGSDDKVGVTTLVGDKTTNFRVCITPPNQDVARYDLQAFGY